MSRRRDDKRVAAYRFGDVSIDCGDFRLLKGGQPSKITPRAFEVLLYLVEHRGRVVGKQELFEQVWKESFVTDNALTRMVKEIRRVIGDDADSPLYIETVPKRGYRFIAATEAETESEERDSQEASAPASIAVLPFANLSADPDHEYLTEGITESIINHLSRVSHLRVVPRSTVFHLHRQERDPLDIGRALRVRAVLTGRVLQRGDALVVKTELLDVQKESQLWGEQYQRTLAAIFDVQEEIAREISAQLRLKLSREEQSRLTERPTRNLEAYQLYLKGRYFWNRRPQGLKRGIDYFEQALEKDSRFALAYAGLADSYNTLGSWENSALRPTEAMPKALDAARRALELDPTLAEAHTALAYSKLHYERDLHETDAGFSRALALNPNYVHAQHWYSHYYMARGHVEASLDASLRAYALDPLDLIINAHLIWHYWLARQPDEALSHAEKTRELDQQSIWPSFFAGLALEQKSMFDEAASAFRQANALTPDMTFVRAALAHSLALGGEKKAAQKILRELEREREHRYVPAYDLALIHLGLGEIELSLRWLGAALEERSGWMAYLRVEPRLDSLRSTPEFAQLIDLAGLR